jgi:hypothetical protein
MTERSNIIVDGLLASLFLLEGEPFAVFEKLKRTLIPTYDVMLDLLSGH